MGLTNDADFLRHDSFDMGNGSKDFGFDAFGEIIYVLMMPAAWLHYDQCVSSAVKLCALRDMNRDRARHSGWEL